jgi:uncharacterized protein YbaA (DUF1428 family)
VDKMAKYIDGFVLVVPKGKETEYQKMAEMGRDAWMKHGALQYFESRGDDLKQQEMGDEKFEDMGDFEMPVDMKKMAYGGFEVAVEG